MNRIKETVLKCVAKAAIKTAELSPKTMSGFYCYEPKLPEKLSSKY